MMDPSASLSSPVRGAVTLVRRSGNTTDASEPGFYGLIVQPPAYDFPMPADIFFPDESTIEKVYDYLDFSRAVKVCLDTVPTFSVRLALVHELAHPSRFPHRRQARRRGKAWYRAFRNHGPPEGWFDKSRKLYDIECMD